MSDPETVGEAVAETIEAAIENAQHEKAVAVETAEMIAKAALETERGNRITELERRLDTWESSQSDTAEAIASLTLGLTQLSGQMSALLTLQQSPTPNPQSEEDGQRESQEEEIPVAVVEPVAEIPVEQVHEPKAQKRKRHNWI